MTLRSLFAPRLVPALVAGALLCAGSAARAQSEGTRIGDGRLHTSIETETHQVYNPGYAPDKDALSDVFLVARPRLRYELPSDVLELGFTADGEYRRYLGLGNELTAKFSTFAGHLGGQLEWNKRGALTLRISESLGRQADAMNLTQATRLLHVTNDFGAGLDFKPGGGALVFSADYGLWYDTYDQESSLDNLSHRVTGRVLWKFLPRTALFLEGTGIITTYPGSPYSDPSQSIPATENPETTMVMVDLSATGAVTSRISALLKVGYGDTLISGDRLRTVVGQAELEYAATGSTKARFGFVRTLLPTSFFKYVAVNRPYLSLEQAILDSTGIELRLDYSALEFGHAIADDSAGGGLGTPMSQRRRDQSIGFELALEHRFRGWLSLSLRERYERRDSDWTPPGSDTKVGYKHNDVTLRLTLYLDAIAAVIAR